MKLAIVIPAYNEAAVIGDVLDRLPKKIAGFREVAIVVVDDGSADDTGAIAKAKTKYAVSHIVNLGVGAATKTGFGVARKIKADIVVTLDADGQHNPEDIINLVAPILASKADVTIGTRMLNPKGMPLHKIIGNWTMNLITFLVFHKWTSDSQSGLKAFTIRAIRKMDLHSIGYEVCSEMIGEIKRNGLCLVEIPIETIYTDHSKAKGQNWLNAVNILTRIIAIRMAGKK